MILADIASHIGFVEHHLLVLLLALLIDRTVGYPDWLYKLIRHPVVWAGGLIGLFDRHFNQAAFHANNKRILGVVTMVLLIAVVLTISWPIFTVLRASLWGLLIEAVLVSSLLSQKSLSDHVRAVSIGLTESVQTGREAVGHIVGRNPDKLDSSSVARAAIESLAENASDGVIAPAFWFLLAGLPGIVIYKAVNTADSMIGYKSDKYRDFGWAAARLDDVLNFVPARLTAFGFALVSGVKFFRVTKVFLRDADKHVSPNAGWPEAAMAGVLDVCLGGPRHYGARLVDLPWMGDGRTDLSPQDIEQALKTYGRLLSLLSLALLFLILV